MKHVHAENMRLYAIDAQETEKPWERWERKTHYHGICAGDGMWHNCSHQQTMFLDETAYRRIDVYRHLRDAQKRGGILQWLPSDCTTWVDNPDGLRGLFYLPVDRYRIKPKTEKQWKWVMSNADDTLLWITRKHCTEETAWEYGKPIQKIDSTMIETDCAYQ